jgi:flagellar hook-associated protein 3 FlgL
MILGRVTQGTLFRQLTTGVSRLQRQIAEAQAQISSQKKLRNASDDPAGAAQANRLRTQTRALAAIDDGIGFGTAVLNAQDSVLGEADNLLTRAREIAAQTSSGLVTQEARQQAAAEVTELERNLLAIANTQIAGRYVFGGLVSGAAPFANFDDPGFDATTAYSGPADPFTVPIGAGQTVALTTPGDQVFGTALTALDDMRQTLAAGASPDTSLDAIGSAAAVIRQERSSVGGRMSRLQDRSGQIGSVTDGAQSLLSGIEDADLTSAISQLLQLQTALQATLAVGGKLQTSVLDYLQL